VSVPVSSPASRLVVAPLSRVLGFGLRKPRIDDSIRRLFDVVFASLALLVLLPVLVAIAILIRLDSPGSVLFVQRRVGKNGTEFPFYKFRSMRRDAEDLRPALVEINEASGPLFKIRRDPRITRVGRFLRRWSLDELPQLINILRGEMSLVGPRPALPCEVETYTSLERERLLVTPGLTGLWQVSGRSDLSFEESIALDLDYIRRRTLILDLLIVLRTFPAVLGGKGAY